MEGGVSKYHSLPTVFSGNDYKAAISANEVKRIGWHFPQLSPLPKPFKKTDENSHSLIPALL